MMMKVPTTVPTGSLTEGADCRRPLQKAGCNLSGTLSFKCWEPQLPSCPHLSAFMTSPQVYTEERNTRGNRGHLCWNHFGDRLFDYSVQPESIVSSPTSSCRSSNVPFFTTGMPSLKDLIQNDESVTRKMTVALYSTCPDMRSVVHAAEKKRPGKDPE